MQIPITQTAGEWVDQVLEDAIHKKASDIHIEPTQHDLRCRLRIDGLLYPYRNAPANQASAITARLKILANLDIGQQRLPQDGRMRFQISNTMRSDEFRVSTCPTLFGEKIVLRHLDTLEALPKLQELGMSAEQLKQFEHAINRPWGLILVTGPTGSGKTVTLYSALATLNQTHRNIATIEDPIEMTLPGINQVQCHESIGLGFSQILRTFLRQDPDVMMIGEVRDAITAKMTVEAAQTGHLVFSTLHTNTALATLTRLRHLGISENDISQSLRLVVAQSLMRKLHSCCQPDESSAAKALQRQHPNRTVFRAVGCGECRSGYLGRIGVFETLALDPYSDPNSPSAHLGQHVNIRAAALDHVLNGISSIEEMHRITTEIGTTDACYFGQTSESC